MHHGAHQRTICKGAGVAAGVGAGASGASAGLLHPYTPRGKLLWRGEECMAAALDLVAAAEAAAACRPEVNQEAGPTGSAASEPFVWRQPIMRPAISAKQVSARLQSTNVSNTAALLRFYVS